VRGAGRLAGEREGRGETGWRGRGRGEDGCDNVYPLPPVASAIKDTCEKLLSREDSDLVSGVIDVMSLGLLGHNKYFHPCDIQLDHG
jgi:hypothetical protein